MGQTTQTNSEKLSEFIAELSTLRTTWEGKSDKPMDVGECGGSTITQLEDMGQIVLDMRTAFVTLLNQTISYMEGRKDSIDTKEDQAATAINGVTAGVTAVLQPDLNK